MCSKKLLPALKDGLQVHWQQQAALHIVSVQAAEWPGLWSEYSHNICRPTLVCVPSQASGGVPGPRGGLVYDQLTTIGSADLPKYACQTRLAEEYPDRAVAWFAVGCYYLCAGQHESARRFFGKATAMDAAFAPAWLGFGHAFAAQDESDQARPPGGRTPCCSRALGFLPHPSLL